MLRQENLIKIRNRGAATMAGLATLAVSKAAVAQSSSAQTGLETAVSTENQSAPLFGSGGLFETITNALLFLVGAISVIMLIVGGIRYILSAGDQQKVTDAKNTIMYAIIGIIIAVLGWAIVNFILGWLYSGEASLQ